MQWNWLFIAAVLACCVEGRVARTEIEPWKDMGYWAGSLAGRHLLDSSSPACEANILYNVVELNDPMNFSAVVTISNNREVVMSHWQLVWTYDSYQNIIMSGAEGAISLTGGSPGGAPVRLVDSFTTNGIAGNGGAYAFLTTGQFVPSDAYSNESLLVDNVNLNGMDCWRQVPGPGLILPCLHSQGSTTGTASDGGCRAVYCCGYMLSGGETNTTQSPAIENGDTGTADAPPTVTPPPATAAPSPSPPPVVAFEPNPQPSSPEEQKSSSSPPIGLIAGAAAGGTVGLVVAGLTIFLLRRRRQQRQQQLGGKNSRDQNDKRGFSNGSTDKPLWEEDSNVTAGGGTASIELRSGEVGKKLSKAWSITSGATLTLPGLQPSGGSDASTKAVALEDQQSGSEPSASDPATSAHAQLDSTEMVNQVTLYDQLGSGAFGTVYRAEWCGRPVAVKVLQMTCRSASTRELDSFRREVEVLSSLKHRHIIQFLAACTVPPNICIIEELAEGGSLHTRLHGKPGARRRAPLPYTELLKIAAGIADAMVYLHPKVVHRDLKSQNVLLDAEGEALVCDFGIAKYKDRTFVSTANGQAGTPAYMAPEMFDGAGITEKVDVFAFGVLLWEMLTGEVPWSHVPSPMQIIYCVGVMGQRLPIPHACPPLLRHLIERCWAEQPGDRPRFLDILGDIRAEAVSITTCPAPPEAVDEPSEDDIYSDETLTNRNSTALGPIDQLAVLPGSSGGEETGVENDPDSPSALTTGFLHANPVRHRGGSITNDTSGSDATTQAALQTSSSWTAASVSKSLQLKAGRRVQLGLPSDSSSGTPSPFASVAHEAFPETDSETFAPSPHKSKDPESIGNWRQIQRLTIPSAAPADLA